MPQNIPNRKKRKNNALIQPHLNQREAQRKKEEACKHFPLPLYDNSLKIKGHTIRNLNLNDIINILFDKKKRQGNFSELLWKAGKFATTIGMIAYILGNASDADASDYNYSFSNSNHAISDTIDNLMTYTSKDSIVKSQQNLADVKDKKSEEVENKNGKTKKEIDELIKKNFSKAIVKNKETYNALNNIARYIHKEYSGLNENVLNIIEMNYEALAKIKDLLKKHPDELVTFAKRHNYQAAYCYQVLRFAKELFDKYPEYILDLDDMYSSEFNPYIQKYKDGMVFPDLLRIIGEKPVILKSQYRRDLFLRISKYLSPKSFEEFAFFYKDNPEIFFKIAETLGEKNRRAINSLRHIKKTLKNDPTGVLEVFEKYQGLTDDLISAFDENIVEAVKKHGKHLDEIENISKKADEDFAILYFVKNTFLSDPESIVNLFKKYKENTCGLIWLFKEDIIDIDKKYNKEFNEIIEATKDNARNFFTNCSYELTDLFKKKPEYFVQIAKEYGEQADEFILDLSRLGSSQTIEENLDFFTDITRNAQEMRKKYRDFTPTSYIYEFLKKDFEKAKKLFDLTGNSHLLSEISKEIHNFKHYKRNAGLFDENPDFVMKLAEILGKDMPDYLYEDLSNENLSKCYRQTVNHDPDGLLEIFKKYKNKTLSLIRIFEKDTVDAVKKYGSYLDRIIKASKKDVYNALAQLVLRKDIFFKSPEELAKISECAGLTSSVYDVIFWKFKDEFKQNPGFFVDVAKEMKKETVDILYKLNRFGHNDLVLKEPELFLKMAKYIKKKLDETQYSWLYDPAHIKNLLDLHPKETIEIAKELKDYDFMLELGKASSIPDYFKNTPKFVVELAKELDEGDLEEFCKNLDVGFFSITNEQGAINLVKKYKEATRGLFWIYNSDVDAMNADKTHGKYIQQLIDLATSVTSADTLEKLSVIKDLFKKYPKEIVDITREASYDEILDYVLILPSEIGALYNSIHDASKYFEKNPDKFVQIAEIARRQTDKVYDILTTTKNSFKKELQELFDKDYNRFIHFIKSTGPYLSGWLSYHFDEFTFDQAHKFLKIIGEPVSPHLLISHTDDETIEKRLELFEKLKKDNIPFLELYNEWNISEFQRYSNPVIKHFKKTFDDLFDKKIKNDEKLTLVVAAKSDHNDAYEMFSMWDRELKKFIENDERVALFETSDSADVLIFLDKLGIYMKNTPYKFSRVIFAGHGNSQSVGDIWKKNLPDIKKTLNPIITKYAEIILEGCNNAKGTGNIYEETAKEFEGCPVYAQAVKGGRSIVITPTGTINGSQAKMPSSNSADKDHKKGYYDQKEGKIIELDDFEKYISFEVLFKDSFQGFAASLGFEDFKFDAKFHNKKFDFSALTKTNLLGLINLGVELNYNNGGTTLLQDSRNNIGYKGFMLAPDGSPELINRAYSDWFYPALYFDIGGTTSLEGKGTAFELTAGAYWQINKPFDLPIGLDFIMNYKMHKKGSDFIDRLKAGCELYLELGRVRLSTGIDYMDYSESKKGLLKENGMPDDFDIRYHGAIELYATDGEGKKERPVRFKLYSSYMPNSNELTFGFVVNIKNFGEILDKLRK